MQEQLVETPPSRKNSRKLKPNRSWFTRTFSTMKEGSLRAQIFLLIITTMGSSFFVLPFSGKKIGIGFTILMLCFSAFVSFASSSILFMGYRETKAKTYNECVKMILGWVISSENRVYVQPRSVRSHFCCSSFNLDFRLQISDEWD